MSKRKLGKRVQTLRAGGTDAAQFFADERGAEDGADNKYAGDARGIDTAVSMMPPVK